jgi:phosphatidylglycerophosphate synthase
MVESIKELRKICQTHKKIPVSEVFQRKISIYFTKLLLYTDITANQVTLLNIIIGIIAGIFFYGHSWYTFFGALMLCLWCIFDCVDGEIARYRGNPTITGLYLDRLNGIIVEPWVFASLTFANYSIFNDVKIFIFGFLASISILLIRLAVFTMYASAVDVYLQSESKCTIDNRIKKNINNINITELQECLDFHSTFIYNIVDFMLSPGMEFALIVTSMLDILFPSISIASFTFNGIYIFLIIYSIFLLSLWIGIVSLILKKGSCEKMYLSLFSKALRIKENYK